MNNLSWLIYLGDIVGAVDGFTGFMAVVTGVATIILTLAYFGTVSDDPTISAKCKVLGRWTASGFLLAAFLAVASPSKETIYMIAASEAGETVIKTPTGQRAIEAVNRYLDSVATDKKDDRHDD